MKLGRIVDVVMRCQQDANAAAAPCTQNIFEAMQTVLDQRGILHRARQFAQEHGIDTTRSLGSPSEEAVTQQVQGYLVKAVHQKPDRLAARSLLWEYDQGDTPPPRPSARATWPRITAGRTAGDHLPQAHRPQDRLPATSGISTKPAYRPPRSSGKRPHPHSRRQRSIGQPGMNAPLSPNAWTSAAPPNAFGQSALSGAQPPNAFMQGFDHGLNQGAPTSAALNNVPPVTGPVQPQVPVQPPVSDVPASTAPATAPAVDAPPATAAPSVQPFRGNRFGCNIFGWPGGGRFLGPSRTHRFVADIWL